MKGADLFPVPDDCATVAPYQLVLSPDRPTVYTYGAYYVNGVKRHGIGGKQNILLQEEEEVQQIIRTRKSGCPVTTINNNDSQM